MRPTICWLCSLAAVFGTLVARLVADMDGDTDVNTCLSGFRNLAWRHDAPTRLSCAAGFLAVLKAANPRRWVSANVGLAIQ